MRKLFTIAFILIVGYCDAQQSKPPQLVKMHGPLSSGLTTALLKKAATGTEKDSLLYLVSHIAIGFPNTPKTFREMQGYGILYLTVVNPISAQLSVKRMFIKDKNGNINALREIGRMNVMVNDPRTKRAFGKNRTDYYYLIPYRLTRDSCDLYMRWTDDDVYEMLLARFPSSLKLTFVRSGNAAETGDIDPRALQQFMLHEFHIQL